MLTAKKVDRNIGGLEIVHGSTMGTDPFLRGKDYCRPRGIRGRSWLIRREKRINPRPVSGFRAPQGKDCRSMSDKNSSIDEQKLIGIQQRAAESGQAVLCDQFQCGGLFFVARRALEA